MKTHHPLFSERNKEIYRRHKEGESQRVLARKFGISSGRVSQIIARQHWKMKDEMEKARQAD